MTDAAQGDEAVQCTEAESKLNQELLEACRNGADVERIKQLLRDGADAAFQETEGGTSVLMHAAGRGDAAVVKALLEAGAPWNALDRAGRCAGEWANDAGHEEAATALLDAGCRAELLLMAIDEARALGPVQAAAGSNDDYLSQRLKYDEDNSKLMDAEGEAVMMDWEAPLMQAHAAAICQTRGDVLNVGFGLGIVDNAIQECQPRSHTIVEAHPDVLARMKELGWYDKEGVTVLEGRWQDALPAAGRTFDGIFFDTYGEYYEDMRGFHRMLPKLLKPGGVYSYFNGLAPDNPFFHAVYCEVVRLEMAQLGLETLFLPLPMGPERNKHGKAETWDGVKNRYWWGDVYHLPVCQMADPDEDGDSGGSGK